MIRKHMCPACGCDSPVVHEHELRRAGWALKTAAAGVYTILQWFCPSCEASTASKRLRAS